MTPGCHKWETPTQMPFLPALSLIWNRESLLQVRHKKRTEGVKKSRSSSPKQPPQHQLSRIEFSQRIYQVYITAILFKSSMSVLLRSFREMKNSLRVCLGELLSSSKTKWPMHKRPLNTGGWQNTCTPGHFHLHQGCCLFTHRRLYLFPNVCQINNLPKYECFLSVLNIQKRPWPYNKKVFLRVYL